MISAVFCVLFGLSLLPGRKPLCVKFAERISDGILPEGALAYCRRLTWFWFLFLAILTGSNLVCFGLARGEPRWGWAIRLVPSVYAAILMPLVFFIERRIRNRRFRIVFHTSGSTGKSKEIVKRFETLAKEVALHRRNFRAWYAAETLKEVTFLGTVQWDHMLGKLWMELLPPAMGVPAECAVLNTPEALLARMRVAKRVILVTTPSFLDRFTNYAAQYDVPQNCLDIVTSGALLTRDVSDRTERVFGVAPLQIFGSTETGGVASRRRDEPWRVFDDVRVRVVDGRLAVKSPFSFRRDYVMGDGVELAADGRTFKLLGRLDRLVKINEERVNLAEMEEKVKALGHRDCALVKLEGRHGPFLGLVLVGAEVPPLELRRRLLSVFPKGTVPKRFRFVAELPRNPQGKVVATEIAALFDRSEAGFCFDGTESFFQGHFPGAPVLPGVVQLGLAVEQARKAFGFAEPLTEVRKMKFIHVIEPRQEIRLRVVKKDDREATYEFTRGEALCSSGVLRF